MILSGVVDIQTGQPADLFQGIADFEGITFPEVPAQHWYIKNTGSTNLMFGQGNALSATSGYPVAAGEKMQFVIPANEHLYVLAVSSQVSMQFLLVTT